jgi:hypothetical protein
MSDDYNSIAKSYWDQQPHPRDPSGTLKIGEFATAVKLATMAKFGGHANAHEAALFWPEFKATGMSPEEFEHTLNKIAPLSFTYHGRPPTMKEIANLKDAPPHEATKYFHDLPHRIYGDVTAGAMVKAVQAAKPHAMEHLGREPELNEARYLHHSGEPPANYYARLGAQAQQASDNATNGASANVGANPGGRGVATPGGPQANQ